MEREMLESYWDELGLSEAEKTRELKAFEEIERNMHEKYSVEYSIEKNRLLEQIRKLKVQARNFLVSVNAEPDDIEELSLAGLNGTLRERLRQVESVFNKYKDIYQERILHFQELHRQISELSDKLCIPESQRGEFQYVGTEDLSLDRAKRFISRIDALNFEIQKETLSFNRLKSIVTNLIEELGEEPDQEIKGIIDSPDFLKTHVDTLRSYHDQLVATKSARTSLLSQLALDLTHLWNLFGLTEEERDKFVQGHLNLSADTIQKCYEEVQRLTKLKQEQLPEIVNRIIDQIKNICTEMHFTEEQKHKLLSEHQKTKLEDTFDSLEQLLLDLKSKQVIVAPIIDLIEQREDIIHAFQDTEAKKRRSSTRRASEVVTTQAEEKIRRRQKFLLPRIEKKLRILLIEYEENNKEPFMWDGKSYSENLSHIRLSNSEIAQAKQKRRRHTHAPSK